MNLYFKLITAAIVLISILFSQSAESSTRLMPQPAISEENIQESHEVEVISKPETGGNDSNPKWSGDFVYFRSDRNGGFNLFSYNTQNKTINQLTHYTDYPVIDLDVYMNTFIFEQAGLLHTLNTETGEAKTIDMHISADLPELHHRFISGKEYARSAAISPSGKRVVLDFRGEAVTVPVNKGDPDNLTHSPGAHENQPQWSPNGRYIAYFSDASGEYELRIKDLKNDSVKSIELNGVGFYAYIHWSLDNKKVSFVDNGRSLYLTDVASGKSTQIASDKIYLPGVYRELFGSWSHDSKWIAYT